jgi:catechol 2,3-dioxygenase-like lactoylglutathione lyase family enzyme
VARLYRLMMPVPDLEAGVAFYARLLREEGERVSSDRHYFPCGEAILAVLDPAAEGRAFRPNPEWTYLAFDDLDGAFDLVREAEGARIASEPETQPWGERSGYAYDPFGNPLCLVEGGTEFTGGRFVP